MSGYDVVRILTYVCQDTMSYVRIRYRTSGYDVVRQDTMSYVRIRYRTSGYYVVRQDAMSYTM
jgi:hypothetical protein